LVDKVSLGVICPAVDSRILESWLYKIHQRHEPSQTEKDHLLSFPGFQSVFGLPIEIPQPGNVGWVTCPELDQNLNEKDGALRLAQNIVQAVTTLQAACSPSVTLIFIPDRWRKWRKFETEEETFDLHNFVKAFAVEKGISTQFLERETMDYPYQCRIWWWLSLAFYVKSMRTPWALESLDHDTAFVGLGFSLDRKAEKGKHIVLGCSHLYNARGEGLQYRLSKIENPVIRRGNPFMSRDDAQRVGETIRELFFDARSRLPRRVVIHKQTPFLKDEREGLREGLSGVDDVEMLEIHIDHALRYVASVPKPDGSFREDNYPVKRGTVVKLDQHTALLWIHGVAPAVNPALKYYKGKRRIPAPLVLKRGSSGSRVGDFGAF